MSKRSTKRRSTTSIDPTTKPGAVKMATELAMMALAAEYPLADDRTRRRLTRGKGHGYVMSFTDAEAAAFTAAGVLTDAGKLDTGKLRALLLERGTDPEHMRKLTLAEAAALVASAPKADADQPAGDDGDLAPADHFSLKWGINADRLRKARRDGRLTRCEKRGGRWYYSTHEAATVWPHDVSPD